MKKLTNIAIILFTIISVFLFTIPSLTGCNKTSSKQLNINVWEGYLSESVAALFEKETGINLNITLTTGNPMLAAYMEGGGKSDIIMPSQSYVYRYYEAGLAQPLDLDKIPNYKKVSKSLKEQPWTKWNGSQMGTGEIYVIPYIFGTTGLVINTAKYKKSLDDIGWEVLFDTDLKGRVSSKNMIYSVLLILDLYGIPREDLETDTEGTLEKIRDKTIALKNNVLKFYNTNTECIDLLKNEEIWVALLEDGGGRKLSQSDPKFKYILPKTGGLAWVDTFMIPANASNVTGAHMFIDFMLRPDIAARVISDSGYGTTVEGALDMTEGIDKNLYRFTDEEMEKLIFSPSMSEEMLSTYMTFWEEITTVQ